jgi:hypothetical protein
MYVFSGSLTHCRLTLATPTGVRFAIPSTPYANSILKCLRPHKFVLIFQIAFLQVVTGKGDKCVT